MDWMICYLKKKELYNSTVLLKNNLIGFYNDNIDNIYNNNNYNNIIDILVESFEFNLILVIKNYFIFTEIKVKIKKKIKLIEIYASLRYFIFKPRNLNEEGYFIDMLIQDIKSSSSNLLSIKYLNKIMLNKNLFYLIEWFNINNFEHYLRVKYYKFLSKIINKRIFDEWDDKVEILYKKKFDLFKLHFKKKYIILN